ncbi:MAG: DEAD/DEAH box helicase family protein, partial [Dactylosporangium sp.]|nr:DEAD/DEAH box helicase family protein [Dactylosporangium sp.]
MSDRDLRYEPPCQGYGWLHDLQPASCLAVGDVPDGDRDTVAAVAPDVRSVENGLAVKVLHRGVYAFRLAGTWHALVVASGMEPREPDAGRARFLDERHHLTLARFIYEDLWESSRPFAGRAKYRAGDMVLPKGGDRVGRVPGIVPVGDGYHYRVDVRGEIRLYSEAALEPAEGDPSEPRFWLSRPPAPAADIALTLTWTKLRHPLTDTLYSYAASKTIFFPYQFKPVLKVLTGSSGRLLIADEVGLGKTIEAGLIWTELEQRIRMERVLVVAPATLTLKWKAEMERRFDRRLDILRVADLAEFAEQLSRGAAADLHGVISLQALRSADKVLDRLTALHPHFDLVIVDEAHELRNRNTKSHALGRLLAEWADYLIFLSATPLNLGSDDLFNLVNLLDEANFADRAIFDAQLAPNEILNEVARALTGEGRSAPRKLVARLDDLRSLQFGATIARRPDFAVLRGLLDVDRPLDHAEVARARRLLADLNVLGSVLTRTRKADLPRQKAVREPRTIDVQWTNQEQRYYDAIYDWYMMRARKMGTPPGFAMQMPLRQAASCIPASQALLRSREPGLFRREVDDFDEDVEVDLSGLPDVPALTTPLTVDTKYDRLLAELLRVRAAGSRQVMIFSFFRRTLHYLAQRLGEHFTVAVMHGGVAMADREQIMRDFRDGKFEILLLSEVGSEGLDFEFCNVLVNYDLPWNPMRVEQRIGRLDRFGQENEKIFIYNMHVPGTIETDIFQRLYDRIGVFSRSIGELEPILRDELGDITRRILDPRRDDKQRREEIDRIAVALQRRAQDTDELRASQAQLSGLDSLLIEGMTDKGPGQGRFIGVPEIQRMLDELFQRTGGRRTAPDGKGIFHIIGSDELAARLRSTGIPDGGSRYSRAKLATLLQDKTKIACAFEPETASRYDVELIAARHPLVKLAMHVLAAEALSLPRFGSVAVPGLPAGASYLVTIDLAETTGLRPLLELWATAVNADTRQVEPEVGDTLLAALAAGQLYDGPRQIPPDLVDLWHV